MNQWFDRKIIAADGKSYSVTDVRELQGSDLALVCFNSDRYS